MPEPFTISPGDELLIGSPSAWREACFSLPAVRALATAGARITIAADHGQQQFWKAAGFGGGPSFPKGTGARKLEPLIAGAARLLVWEPGELATAGLRAGIPFRLGPRDDRFKKELTNEAGPRPRPGPPEHRVAHYLSLAGELGAEPYLAEHFGDLDTGVTPTPGAILLVPDSDFGENHEWPLKSWYELVGKLLAEGKSLTIGQAKGSARLLGEGLARLSDLPLIEFELPGFEALAAHPRVIAAECAAVHIAAAAGAICSVLYGPGSPEIHRPLGRRHHILRRKAECSPCFSDRCALDMRCQLELTTDDVLAGLHALSPA